MSDNCEIVYSEPNRVRRMTIDGSKFEAQTTKQDVRDWAQFICDHFDDSKNNGVMLNFFKDIAETIGVDVDVLLSTYIVKGRGLSSGY